MENTVNIAMGAVHRPTCRLLHTSDLHLLAINDHGCRTLNSIINLTVQESVNLLLIAGDLFDQNQIDDNVLEFVKAQFSRISIPIIILPGNHDCLVEDSVYNKSLWQNCPDIHIIRRGQGEIVVIPKLNVSVWGKAIDTYFDVRPFIGVPQPERNGNWNIAAAHGLVVKHLPHHTRSYIITEAEIKDTSWDYIALGHMTIFERVWSNPPAYYCGSATEKGTVALVDLNEETGVEITRCDIMKNNL